MPFEVSWRIIFWVCSSCFIRRLTSSTGLPEPAAILRFVSGALKLLDAKPLYQAEGFRQYLPEEALCYLRHRKFYWQPYIPAMLAYELDRGDRELEAIVTGIINGENGFREISIFKTGVTL